MFLSSVPWRRTQTCRGLSWLLLAISFSLQGCGWGVAPRLLRPQASQLGGGALVKLAISPPSVALSPGGTVQFDVTGTWNDGSSAVPPVTYAATGGTITPTGLFTAGKTPGQFYVIASGSTNKDKADSASVDIASVPVTTIHLAPGSIALYPGQSTGLSATLLDAHGDTLTGRTVLWASSDTMVAAVTPGGSVTARNAGNSVISARSEKQVAQVQVAVQAPLFYDGFEGGSLDQFVTVGCCSYSATVVHNSVSRRGRSAARIELRASDSLVGASHRSELRVMSGSIVGGVGSERWYGLSIYVPNSWKVDSNPHDYQILAQWHNLPDVQLGEGYTPPPLAIWIDKGDWSIWSYWDPSPVTHLLANGQPAPPGGSKVLWRGTLDTGRWTDWVVHTKWSYGPDGLLEIWKDGTKIVSESGPNTYNDIRPLYFMVGLYKWMWDDPTQVWTQPTRTAFFDEIRIVGAGGSYAAVAPR